METWIETRKRPALDSPTAIVGSQGLRSVGIVAIEHLIDTWKGELFAEMYSSRFPVVYQGVPYAGVPGLPGSIITEEGTVESPRVEFYSHGSFIIVKGYNPDNMGQYAAGQAVVEFLKDLGTSRIITLGGFVHPGAAMDPVERRISFCATDMDQLKTMEEAGLQVYYTGPFLGFSALVLGLGKEEGIPGAGLFGQTVPYEENPLLPDPPAARALLEVLARVLGADIDTSGIPLPEPVDIDEELLEFFHEDSRDDDVGYI
ncbi:MAG: hypothetical protein GXO65_05050 [Euryarchaeota archaeon]|nr:hypothetical protein [Euryarchaeota archaeon]